MRSPREIRNIALIGHGGDGKTTVAEAMLFNAKVIDRMGTVPAGNTQMDYDPEETKRGISLSLAVANFEWNGAKLNIIDVPGFFDFEGELIQAMHVADAAVVVVAAGGGVPVGAEKALDFCVRRKIPAMIFLSQMDKENADYFGTLRALQAKYGKKIAPIQVPIMEGTKISGYISLLSGNAYEFAPTGRIKIEIPARYKDDVDKIKNELTEIAAENDEELMIKFFDGEALTNDEIIAGVRKGISLGDTIPLLAGSGLQNKGVINLLDQIVRVLPGPADRAHTAAEGDKTVEVACDPAGKPVCQVFKTITDPFVGKLSLFKVFSGTVRAGQTLYNVNAETNDKAAGLYVPRGKKQVQTDELSAGDIGAFAKLQYTKTGDTLAYDGAKILMPAIVFPEPVFSLAVGAAKQGEEDKVFSGLQKLMEEDNTIRITRNTETTETLICGMGETHVDVTVKKLKNKFGVDAKTSVPRIPYRETIRKKAEAEGKHKKQSGGHGQYGHCKVRFEPYPDGDFLFAEEVVGGTVPKNFIPAVEKGLIECINGGVLAGYKVVNIKCTLYDGSYHDVDSSEMAFKIAARLSFVKGCEAAGPTILEPIYSYQISVPEAYLGAIMGDMNKRRGRVLGTEAKDDRQLVTAEAPMAEMVRYATDLRSMTQGRGAYTQEYVRYEEVPSMLIAGIVAASPFKKANVEE